MTETTVNADEIAKFSAMADDWWDPDGDFKPLHKFNPVRLAYIRDWALKHFRRDETERRPLDADQRNSQPGLCHFFLHPIYASLLWGWADGLTEISQREIARRRNR